MPLLDQSEECLNVFIGNFTMDCPRLGLFGSELLIHFPTSAAMRHLRLSYDWDRFIRPHVTMIPSDPQLVKFSCHLTRCRCPTLDNSHLCRCENPTIFRLQQHDERMGENLLKRHLAGNDQDFTSRWNPCGISHYPPPNE